MDLSFLQSDNIQNASSFLQELGLNDNENDTRAKILSCWASVDIPSCPGSGKTTILVAKLAWAIERWEAKDMGICVLSHTNVAKDEIRRRLTSNQANKLLGYPHFVGTIHEFLNRFLAIPWLKAMNIPIRNIDNDYAYKKCTDAIWKVDKKDKFDDKYKKKFASENHKHKKEFTSLSWRLDDITGVFQLSNSQTEYLEFQKLIKKWSTQQGYHTHDDMLAFSEKLLSQYETLASILCARFPLVLIDEAQDTNEAQSKILNKIFAPNRTIVQRFGDDDQQIYDFGETAITNPFPNPSRTYEELQLSETQRCNSSISVVASKFSLSGKNIISVVAKSDEQPRPRLILFDANTIDQVIPTFTKLVDNNIKLLPDSVIKAVGQIGHENLDDTHWPRTICHYEPGYVKPNNRRSGRPKNLRDLINNSRDSFLEDNENFRAINIFFSGVMRLLAEQLDISYATAYPFRNVKTQLSKEALNLKGLQGEELFQGLLDIYNLITMDDPGYPQIKSDLETLLKRTGFHQYMKSFFEPSDTQAPATSNRSNANELLVEINTIAGVKGETHTATLVLETYFRKHNIEDAIRAIPDINNGKKNIPKPTSRRIKHLYVAMTRPTSFLCLALPKSKYESLCENQKIKEWFSLFELVNL